MKSSRRNKSSIRKDFKRQPGGRFHRARTLETLEGRVLLAGDTAAAIAPFHNRFNSRDVNFDNRVSATDALYVISDLLNTGPRSLPQTAVPLTAGGSSGFRYVDVNGDNRVTAHDALLVVNQLLATTQMDVTANIKDLGGNLISSVDVGQDFLIEINVQDVRDPVSSTPGVFSAFVNLNYDPNLIEIFQQTPDAGPDFSAPQGQQLDLSSPGFIPGFLLISGLSPRPNNNVQQLFTIVAHAKAGGVAAVSPSFDSTPASDMLLYPDVLLTEPEIQFSGTTISINAGAPAISVSDVSMSESNSGTTPFVFTVSLSSAAPSDVTVAFATQDGTATQPSDYAATSGTLVFAAGQTTKLVTVLVNGDLSPESNETFTLNLSNPTGAELADATGLGTILTDDAIPTLAIGSVSKAEGNSGTTSFVFTASLSAATNAPVLVAYNTANGTAVAPGDYAAQSGTVTFAIGETTKLITVAVVGDADTEANETFAVQLTRVSGTLTNDNAEAIGTILNDEGQRVVVRLQVTDLSGNPLPPGTSLNPNDTFLLRAYVQDIQSTPLGVGLAYVDVTFDPNLVALNGAVVFGPNFPNANDPGNTSTLGLIDEIGALGTFPAPPNPGAEALFFSVPFRAVAAGVATFGIEAAEGTDHEIRLYTDDAPVAQESINYVGTQLLVGANTVSIIDTSDAEGNAGTKNFVFTLSRFLPSDAPATVVYTTSNGSASTADGDYVGTSGTLTFAPGQASQQITVVVNGDTKNELDESFTLTLSNAVGAVLAQSTATGTIFNDDGVPSLSIGNAAGNEGTNLLFTVTLSAASGQNVIVPFTTVAGSAGSGTDFTATTGTVTFLPGQTQRTISVAALADGVLDPNENFTVVLGTPINGTVAQGTGTGTIGDVPPVVTFSVPSVSQAEGNAGNSSFVFTASLSTPTTLPVVAVFGTSDGTAIAGSDYFATSGTLTFAPGETTKLITVQVVGDTVIEGSETFSLTLAGASGPFTGNAVVATGTIDNDDGIPTLSVNDALGIGPLSGNGSVVFTVTLSLPSATQVVVGYATQNNTALAGIDYIFQSGNLTFAPNEQVKTVTVPTIGQPDPSSDETFFLNLSSPSGNAEINDGVGVGTIARRGIRIENVKVVEGNAGQTFAEFTLSLDDPAAGQVTVAYNTVDGTATTADNDYQAVSGTATFALGTSFTVVTVPVNGDTNVEGDETFTLNLHSALGDVVIVSDGTATIQNDDGQTARFRVQLRDSGGNVVGPGDVLDPLETFTLEVYVQDVRQSPTGIFQGFVDVVYNQAIVAVNGSVNWGPRFINDRQGNVSTPGLLDEMGAFADTSQPATPGAEELFFSVPMRAIDLGVAEFSTNQADGAEHVVLTYLNDDPVSTGLIFYGATSVNVGQNVIAVSGVSQSEGNVGETDFVFTLTRILPNNQPAVVTYATQDVTAHVSDGDYVGASGTLTFAFGETTKFVTVKVKGDLKDEIDETFQLALTAVGNSTQVGTPGVATILDDDAPVSVSVSDASASEGQTMTFTVTLSAVSGRNVLVPYFTQNGSATADLDFQPVSGTLSFAPGQTQKTVTVLAFEDTKSEGNETFQLALGSPTNATVGDGSGQGTIIDIPPASLSGFVYVDLNDNGIKDANETGLGGVTVVAEHSSGYSKAVLTKDDGSYFIDELIAGSYTLTEIQPGFFSDGRDTRFGVQAALNDKFTGISLSPSELEAGYNFGERGVRAEFISAFINRRAFFASAIVTGEWGGQIGTVGVVNPKTGDVWISFDAGWIGQRTIDAVFATNQANVTMKLYNNSLQEVASSFNVGAGHSQLIYNGNSTAPLFLKVSGSNSQVSISVTPPVQSAIFQASLEGGTPSGATFRSGTLASGAPSATPQTSPDADDLVWNEDEDWLD